MTKDLQFLIQRAYVAADVSKPTLIRNAVDADAEEHFMVKLTDTRQRKDLKIQSLMKRKKWVMGGTY